MLAAVASSGVLMNRFLLRNFGVVDMGRLAQELREDLAPYSQCCRLSSVPMERPTAFSQNSLSAVKRWTRGAGGCGGTLRKVRLGSWILSLWSLVPKLKCSRP